mgnify:CR=1 FL=1
MIQADNLNVVSRMHIHASGTVKHRNLVRHFVDKSDIVFSVSTLIFRSTKERSVEVINPIMVHSPRIAAMVNNKRFGADVEKDVMAQHRAVLRRLRAGDAEQSRAAHPDPIRSRPADDPQGGVVDA